MEGILDRTKGLYENKRKCGAGITTLTQQLLCLKRLKLNEVLQVLTGHWNLQKHRSTIGHEVSTTCPKCNLEEETPNHRSIYLI